MTFAAIKLFLAGVPAWVWQALGALAVLAGIFLSGAHWQAGRDAGKLLTEQKKYAEFVAKTEAMGKAAQEAADKQKKADIDRKEKADEKYKTTVLYLSDELDGLRKSNPAGSAVPAAPAGSSRPDLACFDRAEFGAATDGLLADLQGQAKQGAEATVGLDAAKGWAQAK